VVRGAAWERDDGATASSIIRDSALDLFR